MAIGPPMTAAAHRTSPCLRGETARQLTQTAGRRVEAPPSSRSPGTSCRAAAASGATSAAAPRNGAMARATPEDDAVGSPADAGEQRPGEPRAAIGGRRAAPPRRPRAPETPPSRRRTSSEPLHDPALDARSAHRVTAAAAAASRSGSGRSSERRRQVQGGVLVRGERVTGQQVDPAQTRVARRRTPRAPPGSRRSSFAPGTTGTRTITSAPVVQQPLEVLEDQLVAARRSAPRAATGRAP